MHKLDFILVLESVILHKVNNGDHHVSRKRLNALFELLALPPSDKIIFDKSIHMALKEVCEIFTTYLPQQKILAFLCVAFFNILVVTHSLYLHV